MIVGFKKFEIRLAIVVKCKNYGISNCHHSQEQNQGKISEFTAPNLHPSYQENDEELARYAGLAEENKDKYLEEKKRNEEVEADVLSLQRKVQRLILSPKQHDVIPDQVVGGQEGQC